LPYGCSFAIGLIGFLMRRYNIPLAPVVIAVILGPMAEIKLRRALAVSEGDLGILVDSPITITLYLVPAAALSAIQHLRHRSSRKV
jgi:putative tricarboxylic transport membrane protein